MNKELKDFSRGQSIQLQLQQQRDDYLREGENKKLLSEAGSQQSSSDQKLVSRFNPNVKKISSNVKQQLNEKITHRRIKDYTKYKQYTLLEDKQSWVQKNKLLIQEVEEFKKEFFIKNETKRLLKKQSLNTNNTNIEFQQYENTLNNLKNSNIDSMLNNSVSNENKKLSILMQSGLLDKSSTISNIIDNALKLLHQQQSQQQQHIHTQDNIHIQQDNIHTQDTHIHTLIPSDNIIKGFFQQWQLDISQQDYENINPQKLLEFIEEFTVASLQEQSNSLKQLESIKQIKLYEENLFDKFRTNDITLRIKGKLQFNHFTEKECLNYIKYNTKNALELFDMFQQSTQILNPKIASQILQKLSTIHLKENISHTYIIQDYRYKQILKYLFNHIQTLNNTDFALTLYSLGLFHKLELGLIHSKIFNFGIQQIKIQINERLQSLTTNELGFALMGLTYLRIFDSQLDNKICKVAANHLQNYQMEKEDLDILYNLIRYAGERSSASAIKCLYYGAEIMKKYDVVLKGDIRKPLQEIVPQIINASQPGILYTLQDMSLSGINALLTVCNAVNFKNEEINKQIKAHITKKLNDYDKLLPQVVAELATNLSLLDINSNPNLQMNTNFRTIASIHNLFARKIFRRKSPLYIPYKRIAQKIAAEPEALKDEWLSLCVLGISLSDYQNQEFYSIIEQYILEKSELDLGILAQTLNIFALRRVASVELQEKFYNLLENLINRNPQLKGKKTPLNLIQILSSVITLNIIRDSTSLKKFSSFIYKQIQPHLPQLDQCSILLIAWLLNYSGISSENLLKTYLNYNNNNTSLFEKILLNQLNIQYKLAVTEFTSKFYSDIYSTLYTYINELEFENGLSPTSHELKNRILYILTSQNLLVLKDHIHSGIHIDLYIQTYKLAILLISQEDKVYNNSHTYILPYQIQNKQILQSNGLHVLFVYSEDIRTILYNFQNKGQTDQYIAQYIMSLIHELNIQ